MDTSKNNNPFILSNMTEEEVIKAKESDLFWTSNANNIITSSGIVYSEESDSCEIIWDNYEHVRDAMNNGKKVATVVEGDDGSFIILNGYHMVNRVGYMVFKEEPLNIPDYGVYY